MAVAAARPVRAWVLAGLFNWVIWVLMVVLIGSQFLGIVWDTSRARSTTYYGRDPSEGLLPLPGSNDEPYADRAIVCLAQGRTFVPTQLSNVLANAKLARIVDTPGSRIDGFRVVGRDAKMTLDSETVKTYTRMCDRVDFTLTAIQDSCDALGFEVTRDSLRIVDGVFSSVTREIPRALPIVILPFWDNAEHVGFIIPASDGSACIFRLSGMYQSTAVSYGVLRGVPKAVRHAKIIQWMGNPGGVWRNGWYEAPDGEHWYTAMLTSNNGGPYGIEATTFDVVANKQLDCSAPETNTLCRPGLIVDTWGSQLTTTTEVTREDQLFATNGSRFGLFMFDAEVVRVTKNVYALETFISNMSVFMILIRWFVSLGAMLYGSVTRATRWQTTGVGALSSSRTFNLLPVVLLPKLKLTLCAFFTVGCHFEGQQLAFSSAWYLIYPGIVEFMFYFYSVLNVVARVSYRRMSDTLFGPTLLALCALHFFRTQIAESSWFGYYDRIATLVLSDEFKALRLGDFFSTNIAL